MSKLIHIADRVINRPLMVTPEKLAIIAQVLDGRIGIDAGDLGAELGEINAMRSPDASRYVGQYELSDPSDPKSTRKPYRQTDKGVAIVPLIGSLVNRGSFLDSISGMTSYERFGFTLRAAAADRSISSILIDGDTPGGEAIGAMQAADTVREVAAIKPVYSIANGMMASAGYAIASASTRVVVTQDGVLGSIGVVMLHADYSNKLHQQGIKPTLIHAGARKVDGNPYEPLTADVRSELQAEIEKFYSLFVATVAKGRPGMTESAIRATEARTYIGADAVSVGLADSVGSFESVLADLTKRGTVRNSNPKRMNMDDKTYSKADLEAAVLQATTALKTEAAAALAAAMAANETAVAAARGEGAKAERERIKGVLASDEAKGREKSALHFAMSTSLSVDETKAALAGVAKDAVAAGATNAHGLFLSNEPGPGGPKADADAWGDVVAKINDQNKKR